MNFNPFLSASARTGGSGQASPAVVPPENPSLTVNRLVDSLIAKGTDPRAIERARLVAGDSGQRLDTVMLRLGLVSERQLCDPVDTERAAAHGDELARAAASHPDPAVRADPVADPGAGAEPEVAQSLDLDLELETSHPPELLGDELALEASLGGEGGVLVVAAPAATGAGDCAGCGHALGGGLEDLDRVGSSPASVLLGEDGPDPLARQGVADEDDAPAVVAGDEATSGGRLAHDELDAVHGAGVARRRSTSPGGGGR